MIKLNGKIIPVKYFNDGTPRIQMPCMTLSHADIIWFYEKENNDFFVLYCLIRHLQENYTRALVINLTIPYLVHARMDRCEKFEDVFTLKYFIEILNSFNCNTISVFDPHSHVSKALINRLTIIDPGFIINDLLEAHPEWLIFFPDEGSMKRYRNYISTPYVFGIKERNWETGMIENLHIVGATEMVSGRDILIIDDICSRGSTVFHAAKALKEKGANNIFLYVSHCEDTVLKPMFQGHSLLDIPNLITKIYTTNSLFHGTHEKIEIIYEF